MVHGVPIEDWVLSDRDGIAMGDPGDDPEGMRVYLMCMELKRKRLESISQQQCASFKLKRPTDGVARLD